jgi:CRISPR/Cas system endoribonuclease Cas6 (RAMP superfamily)
MAIHLQNDSFLPFPLPEKLIVGWLSRWDQNAGLRLPELDFADLPGRLLVSRYRLRTVSERYRFHDGSANGRQSLPQIGCQGTLTIDGSGLSRPQRETVATLIEYAFYCGSGHHTTMGMGQTWPIVAQQKKR